MFEGVYSAGLEDFTCCGHNVFNVHPQGNFLVLQPEARAIVCDFWIGRHASEDGIVEADNRREVWIPLKALLGPTDGVTVLFLWLHLVIQGRIVQGGSR